MKINPLINQFVIFSGGGGLVVRQQSINLSAGRNVFEVQDVPSSFVEDTVTVELEGTEANLIQVVIKKPDKNFVEAAMNRERDASESILKQATDVRAELREELLTICEGLQSYRYEDSFSELAITFDSKIEEVGTIKISYIINDPRIYWVPSIQVNMSKDEQEAQVTGHILVENQINLNFEDVELKFVEFGGANKQKSGSSTPPLSPPKPNYPSVPARSTSIAELRGNMLGELRKLRDVFSEEEATDQ